MSMKLQSDIIITPEPFGSDSHCLQLAQFFTGLLSEIDRKLVRDLTFISQLAHYKDGMQVTQVKYLHDNLFQLHFCYDWHIFHGCMGMDETGTMKDKANFTLDENGTIDLDLTAFQALSTADEL